MRKFNFNCHKSVPLNAHSLPVHLLTQVAAGCLRLPDTTSNQPDSSTFRVRTRSTLGFSFGSSRPDAMCELVLPIGVLAALLRPSQPSSIHEDAEGRPSAEASGLMPEPLRPPEAGSCLQKHVLFKREKPTSFLFL